MLPEDGVGTVEGPGGNQPPLDDSGARGGRLQPGSRLGPVLALVILPGAVAALGSMARGHFIETGLALPRPLVHHIYYYLVARDEALAPALVALGGLLVWSVCRLHRIPRCPPLARFCPGNWPGVVLSALAVVCLLRVGTALVFADTDLCMDEYAPRFQAEIFSHGRVSAPIPEAWRPLADALAPTWITVTRGAESWLSGYLPVHALLRTPFRAANADPWFNPIVAGLTIVAVVGMARRLFPGDREAVAMATIALAVSPQFVITSLTGYAMPAHLLMNMIWLRLHLSRWWGVAPLAGVLALGLHNPFPHGLFVAPFLLRLVRERRWSRAGFYAAIYALGMLGWVAWTRFAHPLGRAGGGGFLRLFAVPQTAELWVQASNLCLTFAWQTPILLPFIIGAVLGWRRLGAIERDLLLGFLLTFAFFMCVPGTQGHGWGYRYVYATLGNLALLAAAGMRVLRRRVPRERLEAVALVSLGLSLLVQVPSRASDARSFAIPYARFFSHVSEIEADCVFVDPTVAWYAGDAVRNAPFLDHRPKVLNLDSLGPGNRSALMQQCRGGIHVVSPAETAAFGIRSFVPAMKEEQTP